MRFPEQLKKVTHILDTAPVSYVDHGCARAANVEAIICRGHDPYNRWKHHERPIGHDVSLSNSPHSVGGN